MFLVKLTITLVPWLSQALSFSADPSVLSPLRPHTTQPCVAERLGRQEHQHDRGRGFAVVLQLSQSANDDGGGFHYDQEPRGTSFISQISKQDLWERRQMKRPRRRRPQRRPAPNSRGASTTRRGYDDTNKSNAVDAVVESEFDEFKGDVSANLSAMTELLKEMQRSQSAQNSDVQALSLKVADMSDRLSAAEARNQMINNNSPGDMENKNFGTSLDGKFNQKIKDVINEFDRVNPANDGGDRLGQQGGEYYRTKISQIENRINRIDESLQATEEKIDTQMEYIDDRLDDFMDDAAFDGMQFQPRPPPEPFLGEHPPPPPLEELPPPPPPPGGPPPQESYDNPYYVDDGTRYYQERNYNEPNVPPPRMQQISSNQKKQQSDRSINRSSTAHHYDEKNGSFISAFSKADNQNRRRFNPFGDQRRGGNQISAREQLSRGPASARGGGFAMRPPNPMISNYNEESYFYEDEPMVDGPMMEEEYFYDDMYEF